MACVELEIGLHRRYGDSYAVEMRLGQPGNDADINPLGSEDVALVQFDMNRLRELVLDPLAYGNCLGGSLFANPDVRTAFAQARSVASNKNMPLRLRLFIGPSALELHDLRWETLRDPQDGSSLFTSDRIWFSRYLSSSDWRPVWRRAKTKLRALVVIANPSDISHYQLTAVNVTDELARAKTGLGDIPVRGLASAGKATLSNLITHLREGYDILYLICHGALIKDEPWLWLEDENGRTQRVAGNDLVIRLRELQQGPLLVVLASCQSAGGGAEAGTGDTGALAAMGPRMAEAGVPAVLAMQGKVAVHTVAQFMRAFFRELQKDGQIDRAVAVARGEVLQRHDQSEVRQMTDWWMPVLFMRLKSGRIWYKPDFVETPGGMDKWRALLSSIRCGRCIPILGPSLTEPLFGSRREIAQYLAETYHFPLAPYQREDLPQVAQYLSIDQSKSFLRSELLQYLREEILRHHESELPEAMRSYWGDRLHDPQGSPSLDKLISAVGEKRRERDPAEPHGVLARLPLPIYITTDPSNLLPDALEAVGKKPQIELCPWNEDSKQRKKPNDQPDPKRPLVYHLFGRLEQPESLVLTEDDYFNFLVGVTRNKDLLPPSVHKALTQTALLFLGFQLDDWDFKMLFHSIRGLQKRDGTQNWQGEYAQQSDLEGGRILEPARARKYLESYYQNEDISIYWGSLEDFARELLQHWNKTVP